MRCSCGQMLRLETISDGEEGLPFATYTCGACPFRVGVEGEAQELSCLFPSLKWTEEALHALERFPPWVEPLVRQDVEEYAAGKHVRLVTSSFMMEAKNQGAVSWDPEAERRLARVPAPVRAMARVELERTALEQGLPEVTVTLMEEIKARYFGMAAKGS